VRRGLTISEAAAHCGVSVSTYRAWMRQGLVPGFWPNTRRIDRLALDDALDKMSRRGEPAAKLSKYDAWKAGQDAA
jgi:predicted site-specific integrase-resolvase